MIFSTSIINSERTKIVTEKFERPEVTNFQCGTCRFDWVGVVLSVCYGFLLSKLALNGRKEARGGLVLTETSLLFNSVNNVLNMHLNGTEVSFKTKSPPAYPILRLQCLK